MNLIGGTTSTATCIQCKNQPHYTGALRPERKADGHLPCAQRGRECDDAIDAEQRKQHGGSGKAGNDDGIEAPRSLALGNDLVHRLDMCERELRID
jgi:hypothetical protein